LDNGNIVYVEYLQSTGQSGNYFSSFSLNNNSINTVSSAIGGSDPEDVTEIRKNAPKAFSAQNRSVTAKDYESVVYSLYPQAESVKVWGGEENDPPQFGKVFVSIKPTAGTIVPDSDKRILLTSMKSKAVVGIIPEIVDPEYLYAILTVNTNFNPSKTSLSRNEISNLQRTAILNYFDNTLEKFDTSLYLSRLNKILDDVDSSILGTSISTIIEQRIRPSTIYPTFIDLKFYNQIFHPYPGHKGSVRSSVFSYRNTVGEVKKCYIEDDGYGNLNILSVEKGSKIVEKNAGEVDYNTGGIVLFNFKPIAFDNTNHIKIRIQPNTGDIFSMKNKIITTDSASIVTIATTKEENERYMRGGSQDFRDSLSTRNIIPEGPVVVSASNIVQSASPYYAPSLPQNPPLPNSIPIITPTFGRNIP
jgi:hypothetical protein